MKKVRIKKIKGTVALVIVLMVSSMLLVSGIALVLNSYDLNKSTRDFYQNTLAKIQTRNCLEEGLLKLNINSSYLGTFTVTTSNGSCQGTINTNSNPSYRTLAITSTVDLYTFSQSHDIDITLSPMQLVN